MKLMFVLAVVCLAAVVVHCHICTNNDPSECTHTCPSNETKACEHDVCTCAATCVLASDCPDCASHTTPDGHVQHEGKHCIDSACLCIPQHMFPGGNHGGHGGR